MNYFRPLLGALFIIFNIYHTAYAQQELTVLRASSLNQGIHQTLTAPYQRVIKHTREAAAAAGFDIESSERVSDDVYMILGKKTVAGDRYGEMIRALAIRKDPTTSEVRLLVRQRTTARVPNERDCSEKINADIRTRLSSASS